MSLKENLKAIIGRENLVRIKKIMALKKYISAKMHQNTGKCIVESDSILDISEIACANSNVFFGYYDINQFDSEGYRALVHIVPKNADPARDQATLAWIDMRDNMSIHKFYTTKAWSWQQGARLRWHPYLTNCVMFNDFDKGNYLTRVFNIVENKEISTIPVPIYDIDMTGGYGLSLNYDRLQRLRPGYGYSNLQDTTSGDPAPKGDGIYLWKKEDNSVKRIINLADLAENSNADKNEQHYVNHISISPSGRKFLFFHLWTPKAGSGWKTNLYISDIDGLNLKCIESNEIVSHYDWLNDEELLITALGNNTIQHPHYIIYNLKNDEKHIINPLILNKDGHPTWINEGRNFLSDTYPQDDCMQYLFICDRSGEKKKEILKIYSNPFLIEEHRCDLHPRIDEKNNLMAIDTSYSGLRSNLIFKIKSFDWLPLL